MSVKSRCKSTNFRGSPKISTTVGYDGFLIKDTSSSGTPTYAGAAGGLAMTLASTNEAEVVTLYTEDILPYKIDAIEKIIFRDVTLTASFTGILAIGLASAQNDTLDSVTNNVWFRCDGSNSIVCESDDGTNDVDDKATGLSLSTTPVTLEIDFTTEVYSASKAGSKGKQAAFFITDGNGVRRRVAESSAFRLDGIADGTGLQPFVQIQKASGTAVPAVTIAEIEVYYRTAS